MMLQEDMIRFLSDFLPPMMTRRHGSAYLDLIGQNDNSTTTPTGKIGEYISATVASGSAVSLSNNTPANVTSISLTPGDWDVWVNGYFNGGATTTVGNLIVSISTTSATLNTANGNLAVSQENNELIFGGSGQSLNTGAVRISLAATTTVYFVAQAGFAVDTATAYGIIQARRRRMYPG